ncbi:cyclin-H-like isoform X1 [Amphibalanus amphitrite]|nr:cyclin-H-like isoform X1 [Amphibalanus amphitrite]XP_043204062.1 cyclin-H-like isoform X1 [Amphibalanus amphitrite]XP_043204154.1 cyclin-H-like isoform X1 [Amphibalanus amphitrite]XP_043204250.1 cyclin-H-like isoform X1 [Amphibalanus amphitrite]XP_043204343.1 cyclin-H-like isoform X1 [Amphibalanus amphitrite]XP_043204424.1 cyclin-H-like isoform X1 [Amphibalanus amphitrite]XP_043204505.1 cyclin-H-like isoform X1 [Amphibalanus amphitrite]
MFPTSTQKKHWMFKDEEDIANRRRETNRRFIDKHGAEMSEEKRAEFFLTPSEEKIVAQYYECHLRDFCKAFQPPMPKAVSGTASHYFKRFYMHNSVMDFHPKGILVTCVYLSCKVEEFNVSIGQFVANVKGDKEKATDIILNNELTVMHGVHYHLTVHTPFRPVEGLLIDIKTRCPSLQNPDRLRPIIDEFLEAVFFTDAVLLFAPSQVALAAILYAVSRVQENLDAYVTSELLASAARPQLQALVEAVRKIRLLVKTVEQPQRDVVKQLERKLDKCRNQENNPESQAYKRRMREMLEDDDDVPSYKVARVDSDS